MHRESGFANEVPIYSPHAPCSLPLQTSSASNPYKQQQWHTLPHIQYVSTFSCTQTHTHTHRQILKKGGYLFKCSCQSVGVHTVFMNMCANTTSIYMSHLSINITLLFLCTLSSQVFFYNLNFCQM